MGQTIKVAKEGNPLSSGYALYERDGLWYLRFSVSGHGQLRFSLKTRDEQTAQSMAEGIWQEQCILARNGVLLKPKSFADVAGEFIALIEKEIERGQRAEYQRKDYLPVIRNYFVGHFGTKALATIKTIDIEEYWEWRRDYWTSGPGSKQPFIRYNRTVNGKTISIRRPVKEGPPSDSTLSKEALLLRQLFEYGLKRDYTKKVPAIEIKRSKRRVVKSRPAFTLDEFMRLLALSEKRVYETHINEHVRNDRVKLHAFVSLAGYTGLRPTELFNLTWNDIEERRTVTKDKKPSDIIILHARGKGMGREVATMPEILVPLSLLKNVFILEIGRVVEKTDPVFFNADGTGLRTFKKGLNSLLEAASLKVASDGRLRDSFSFRHFYITQMLRSNVHPHLLAINAGTSTKMIDTFYSKVRPTEEASKLAPDWHGHRLIM
ncbi:tyrosine-type recombinase/integrase [Devosia sp. A449]